jgi:hypothetical protein
MSALLAATVRGRDLALELLDPGSETLVRLFRHPGGEWEPPPAIYRNLRVDPPAGHKDDFAVLYTATTLPAVAMECRVLSADTRDHYTWSRNLAEKYQVARYAFAAPALFIPIDGPNRSRLGLDGSQRPFAGYAPYQEAALALHQRYGELVHGLSWESFHRNQPGRAYAVWHHRKASMQLALALPGPYPRLVDDTEWQKFLVDYPEVEEIA